MNKMGLLLKVQILNSFGFNKAKYSKDAKEKHKFTGFAILMVFVGLLMLFYITMYSYIMADQFQKAGVTLELLPALMMAAASVVTLFTTIYKVNGVLFGFKDYDMTMALPVKTEIIVASRLMQLYLMNVGFCAFLTVPSGVIYAVFEHANALYYPMLLIMTLFVPLVPMIIGTAIGSLVTAISSRFRRTGIINLVLSILLVVAILFVSFNTQTVIDNAASISVTLMNAVDGIYPLTKIYRLALCEGDLPSLALFPLISAALFFLFAVIVGRYYKKINTAVTTSHSNANYKMTSLKVSKPLDALYRRELRRYFSSSLYVMNTGIGMILAVMMCICLFFLKPDKLEQMLALPGFADVIADMAPMVLAVFVGMTCTTACSISLEGKSVWIIKSLPVTSDTVFLAKGLVNLTITVPLSVVCALMMIVVIPMNPLHMLFLLLTPLAYALFITEAGLLLNLISPNFEWTSEVTVIKQSMPMMVGVLGGMAVTIAPLIVLASAPESTHMTGLALVTLLVFGIDFIFYRLLKTKGARMFRAL